MVHVHDVLVHCIAFAVIALCCRGTCFGADLPVASLDEFVRAAAEAKPGDAIVVKAGRHEDWVISLECEGTAEQPITVRPESPGAVTFTGEASLQLRGRYIVLRGFVFDGCDPNRRTVHLDQAKNCRVTECRFLNSSDGEGQSVVTIDHGADDNRVDHCEWIKTAGRCVQVRIDEYAAENGPPSRNRLDHNLFQDVPSGGPDGRSAVQLGQNQRDYGLLESRMVVENNLFIRCNPGGQIVSNKSSWNTYRYNLFRDCPGALTMRGGSHCLIEGNRFEGCAGGVRLLGTHHRAVHNVIVNPSGIGIQLGYGTTVEQGGFYQATADCVIMHNTIVGAEGAGIYVGMARDQDRDEWGVREFPPHGNRIERNVIVGLAGDLIKADAAPDNVIDGNLLRATRDAIISDPGTNAVRADPGFVDPDSGDYRRKGQTPEAGAKAEPFEAGPPGP